jgi:predicted transposase/invertase (TIGR01784 family)
MIYSLKDRYIDPLTDFGFKRIFGTEPNKPILKNFLNVLLPEHHRIQDLSLKNVESLGKTIVERKAIFDIFCQAQSGEQFIVEIQKVKQNWFKDRSVYYATFPIQEQAEKGEWDYRLQAVYTVGVLDFIFDDHKSEETLLHTVELKDQDCQVFYDKLKFIYIELPKFKKSLEKLQSPLDRWLFVLRYLPKLDDRPPGFEDEVFDQVFEVAEIANFSPQEQAAYQASLKAYRDFNNVVDTLKQEARQEGVEEGIGLGMELGLEQGLDQGQYLKAMAIAQKLLPTMTDEAISQATELGVEEVQELRRQTDQNT